MKTERNIPAPAEQPESGATPPGRRVSDVAGQPVVLAETFPVPGHEPSLLPPGDWTLVWNDEFDGTELDRTKWLFREWFWRRRMKGFTDRAASIDGNGNLRLSLFLDEDGGLKTSQLQTGPNYHDAPHAMEPNPWGQAPLWDVGEQPAPTFMHRFGYYECRCLLPKLPGWWAAFWLQSPSIGMSPDPRWSGVEVDVMENFTRDGRCTAGSIYGGYGKGYTDAEDRCDFAVDPEAWHRFGLLWTPREYVYYCDGREVTRTDKVVSQVEEFVLLTAEVQGWRLGNMDRHSPKTAAAVLNADGTLKADDAFLVDYVRVFDPAKGWLS